MLRASLLFAALAVSASACPPPEPQPPSGGPDAGAAGPAWKPKAFARATEGCTQGWTCDCSSVPAKAGCHNEATSDESTTGVCAADSGPVTGCTRCMALPPPTTCACKSVCP
jgi:hypothetical protein